MKKIALLAPLFVMALTSCDSTRVTNEGKEISKEELLEIVSNYDADFVPDTYRITNNLEMTINVVVEGNGESATTNATSKLNSELGYDISTEGDYYLYQNSVSEVNSNDESIAQEREEAYEYIKANSEGTYDYYAKNADETEASLVSSGDFNLSFVVQIANEYRLNSAMVESFDSYGATYKVNDDGIVTVNVGMPLDIDVDGAPATFDIVAQFDENGYTIYQGLEDGSYEFSNESEMYGLTVSTTCKVSMELQGFVGEDLARPY